MLLTLSLLIKYISSTNECVDDCLLGENFIGNGNICKSVCDPLIDGNYFIFFKSMETPSYNIYTCKQECDFNSNEKYVEGRNECVTECPDDKPYLNGNTCYSLCLNAPSNQFSFTEEEEEVVVDGVSTTKIKYSCKDECTSEKENYQIDKVCVNGCFGINDIINMKDMSCVNKCDHNSYYKFLKIETVQEEEEEEIEIKKCVESCQKYTVNDYICYEGKNCPKPYNFINGNE